MLKDGNGANDAIHQVIWADLRSKQGFVVRRDGKYGHSRRCLAPYAGANLRRW
jgi:hypothetical protein